MTYTRDDILAMDCQELDWAVYNIQGWEWNQYMDRWVTSDAEEHEDYMPNYSTENAMELLEEFPEWSAEKHPGGYRVIGWETRNGELNKAAEEFGETLEIATCRAWLLWKSQC